MWCKLVECYVPVHVNTMQGDLDIWQGSNLLATLLRKNRNSISRICPAAPGQPLADLCPSFNLSVALALIARVFLYNDALTQPKKSMKL